MAMESRNAACSVHALCARLTYCDKMVHLNW